MRTRILVAALACLAVGASAQQSEKKTDQAASHEVKTPRDMATGQASGRKMNQPAEQQSGQPATARETGSGMATGKNTETSGDPHVQNVSTGDTNADQTAVRESPSKASLGKTSVASGDVDGDGKADKAAATSTDVKSSRDAATGQASGKRQHGTVKVTKEVEAAPKN